VESVALGGEKLPLIRVCSNRDCVHHGGPHPALASSGFSERSFALRGPFAF